MALELIGKANHVFTDGDITSLDVSTINFEKDDLSASIVVGAELGDDSIMIHSLSQWEQLNALVRKAFDGMEE